MGFSQRMRFNLPTRVLAIKIDALKQTVDFVRISPDLDGIYHALEREPMEIAHHFDNEDDLLVDENFLVRDMKGLPLIGFFFHGRPDQIMFSNGLVIGNNERGEATDCKSSLEEIKRQIVFPKKETLINNYFMLTNELLDGS